MKALSNRNGFSYILALTVVMIMGVMLGMVGQSWQTFKKRELEEELIFRGDQVAEIVYQNILCKDPKLAQGTATQFLWTINSPNGTVLDDLVLGKEERCANGVTRKFRLRASAIVDPFTGKQWQIVKPLNDAIHFAGVSSDVKEEPFRKSFASKYDSKLLDEKKQYAEWLFTWELKQTTPQDQTVKR